MERMKLVPVVALAAVALAACSGGSSPARRATAAAADPASITVWLQTDAQQGWPEAVAAATTAFKAKHPNTAVKVAVPDLARPPDQARRRARRQHRRPTSSSSATPRRRSTWPPARSPSSSRDVRQLLDLAQGAGGRRLLRRPAVRRALLRRQPRRHLQHGALLGRRRHHAAHLVQRAHGRRRQAHGQVRQRQVVLRLLRAGQVLVPGDVVGVRQRRADRQAGRQHLDVDPVGAGSRRRDHRLEGLRHEVLAGRRPR